MEIAVLFIGPPGSGKSTQAEYLVESWKLFHLNTGNILKRAIDRGELSGKEWVSGKLTDPKIVLPFIKEAIREAPRKGGLVMSGSPRALYEAFGDENEEGLMPFLEKRYGKENIVIFHIDVPESVSIYRNTHREVKRVIDDPGMLQIRIYEYRKETEPVIEALIDRGYKVLYIDGVAPKKAIADQVTSELENEFGKKSGTDK